MKNIHFSTLALTGLLFAAAAPAACSAGVRTEGAALGEWTMDLDAARDLAAASNKYLFVNFTGSDWCGWCKLMDEHVFSRPGWQAFAREELALAFIDRPQNKDLVPERYRKRNRKLAKQYSVQGFPTFVVFAPDGHEAGRLGASRGGTDANFITNVLAVVIEDRMAELVSSEELAEYRAAQAEKADWERRNQSAQDAFKRKFAIPYQTKTSQLEEQNLAIMARAAEAFRKAAQPNERARDAEVRFSDFGRGVSTNGAAFGSWTTDFGAALALAKESGKDVMVAFTGTRWCDWGNQMESNVFNTVEWMDFAKEHLVLVYVDCPDKDESYLPRWLVEQNAKIYNTYNLRGCPFYLLTDANGKKFESFGATTGITPSEQVRLVETLLARKDLARWVSREDYAAYTNLTAASAAATRQWQRDYDAFLAEMDEAAEDFAPIAEKRNRVFTKAMDAFFRRRAR